MRDHHMPNNRVFSVERMISRLRCIGYSEAYIAKERERWGIYDGMKVVNNNTGEGYMIAGLNIAINESWCEYRREE